MRRIPALLLVAGLAAAPASAVAGPFPTHSDRFAAVEPAVPKGRLGATVLSLTPELRTHLGAPADRGVLVSHVEAGMPGAKAGLAVGDVIVAVRGQTVATASDVMTALARVGTGERAAVEIVRDRRHLTLDATLAEDTVTALWPSWLRQFMKPIVQTARK